MSNLTLPDGSLEDWLSVLKPYQSKALAGFLKDLSPAEAAEKWLSATGSPNIVPFGGDPNTKPFWEKFHAELKRFLCDDVTYVEEKKALSGQGPVGRAIFVSVVSAAIGAHIGYAATLLTPAVAIMLYTAGKIGLNAYCSAAS